MPALACSHLCNIWRLSRRNPYTLTKDLPKAADVIDGYAGPLAGNLTGMTWAQENHPDAEWLLSIASDTPFYPTDLASRLLTQVQKDEALIAVAESNDRIHPVFGLWHVSLIDDLKKALIEEDTRKIFRWMKRHPWTQTSFASEPRAKRSASAKSIDPFFNVNSPEDLEKAQTLIES